MSQVLFGFLKLGDRWLKRWQKVAERPEAAPARTKAKSRAKRPAAAPESVAPSVSIARPERKPGKRQSRRDRYDEVAAEMLTRHGVKVKRWRTSMSGIAWQLKLEGGEVLRLIESPRPRTPLSMSIFLHEVGHHAIGFDVYKPRCLEEYHAWKFALERMAEFGLEIDERVRTRVRDSLRYAVAKARRRGIRSLPEELREFAA